MLNKLFKKTLLALFSLNQLSLFLRCLTSETVHMPTLQSTVYLGEGFAGSYKSIPLQEQGRTETGLWQS